MTSQHLPISVLLYELADSSGMAREVMLQALETANRVLDKQIFSIAQSRDHNALRMFSGQVVVLIGSMLWPKRAHQNVDLNELVLLQIKRNVHVMALGNAVVHLAASGALDNKRVSAHWQLLDSLRIKFPALNPSAALFEWAPPLTTCAGELASLHLALHWIRLLCGAGIATQVADWLQCDKIRQGNERQKVPLQTHLGSQEPKLLEGVLLMEANIEEPLATSEIADYLGISRRQLERLFKKYLQEVPSRYYLNLRLDAAKKLLLESNLSIVEIGSRCGFSSGPHFSTAYRQRFQQTPREERSQFLNSVD
ncbi:hypothetical protein R50072_02460 [Simiduia litorea]|uniref:GlxA family transcriptional regulator n=1 Tax=Simiduia litorea TaxID=1435348 RepID=UPI0036F2D745